MFSAKYRLKNNSRIAQLFRNGKQIHGKYFFIKYLPNDSSSSRIAISVSTKIFKQAVKRNKIKRLTRESFKSFGLSNIPRVDILIIAKQNVSADISLEKVKTDTHTILTRLS